MIGFLKELVGADPGLFQQTEFLNFQRGEIDVEAADVAAGFGDFIDRGNRVEDVAEAALCCRIAFPGNHQQALVALANEFGGIALDRRHVQRRALQVLVAAAESAISTFIAADVGDVERRKKHHAPPVDLLLDFAGGGKEFGDLFRRGDLTQGGDLGLVQTFEFTRFLQDFSNPSVVALCGAEQFVDFMGCQPGAEEHVVHDKTLAGGSGPCPQQGPEIAGKARDFRQSRFSLALPDS